MNNKQAMNVLALVLLAAFVATSACAQEQPPPLNPYSWETDFGGFGIGTGPGATDSFDGANNTWANLWAGDMTGDIGVFTCAYYENNVAPGAFPVWQGQTGFYVADFRGPIAPGGSKTWSDIYLWDQNYPLTTPGQFNFGIVSDWDATPSGYTAEIVLDQIPASADWTGPTDFRVDLSQTAGRYAFITLPIATLSDPSQILTQATEMSITVYAPVPEPSSALPLVVGAIGMAGLALRRRR